VAGKRLDGDGAGGIVRRVGHADGDAQRRRDEGRALHDSPVGPNTRIQPHSHPDDRVATVVSGDWYFGYGKTFDEAGLKQLPPGSFYTEPPGVDHFAMTKATGVVIQISGTGPSGTTYADPRNDPNRK
jgi:uncharacterized RmlC-like cupin family protein